MEIQSMSGMVLKAGEWTREGKRKQTGWPSLGTLKQNSTVSDIRGAITILIFTLFEFHQTRNSTFGFFW
jgi:hypothetical protein